MATRSRLVSSWSNFAVSSGSAVAEAGIRVKSAVVNTQALAGIARNLTDDGLGAYLLLGRGEVARGPSERAHCKIVRHQHPLKPDPAANDRPDHRCTRIFRGQKASLFGAAAARR